MLFVLLKLKKTRNLNIKIGDKRNKEYEKTSGDTFFKESITMKLKLVLTKDELQWLLLQLKKGQGRKFKEMLGEIEKSRLIG